jgi:hypothetical protein
MKLIVLNVTPQKIKQARWREEVRERRSSDFGDDESHVGDEDITFSIENMLPNVYTGPQGLCKTCSVTYMFVTYTSASWILSC